MILLRFQKKRQAHDQVMYKGEVELTVLRSGVVADRVLFPNTTLRSGRRFLAAALGGNLLSTGFDCAVRQMAWGIGGVDVFGAKIPVPDSATTFVGGASNILVTTTADASMALGDEPSVIFHGALGYSSPANGNKVTQIGLKLENEEFWAITTFSGFDKSLDTALIVNWKVFFL